MTEAKFDEIIRVVVTASGLLIFVWLIIVRPLVQEEARRSKERIKRLDGRKEQI
jgi:hypothetical protein